MPAPSQPLQQAPSLYSSFTGHMSTGMPNNQATAFFANGDLVGQAYVPAGTAYLPGPGYPVLSNNYPLTPQYGSHMSPGVTSMSNVLYPLPKSPSSLGPMFRPGYAYSPGGRSMPIHSPSPPMYEAYRAESRPSSFESFMTSPVVAERPGFPVLSSEDLESIGHCKPVKRHVAIEEPIATPPMVRRRKPHKNKNQEERDRQIDESLQSQESPGLAGEPSSEPVPASTNDVVFVEPASSPVVSTPSAKRVVQREVLVTHYPPAEVDPTFGRLSRKLSSETPQPEDAELDVLLETYLEQACECPTMRAKRHEAISNLTQCLHSYWMSVRPSGCTEDAIVHCYGSVGYDAVIKGSDVDLLLILPLELVSTVSREGILAELRAYLISLNGFSFPIAELVPATVPILKLQYGGFAFDVSLLLLARDVMHQNLRPFENVRDLLTLSDTDDWLQLNGYRATRLIAALTPDMAVFSKVLRLAKYWAALRGIYSSQHGLLAGVALAIMVLDVCLQYPMLGLSGTWLRFLTHYGASDFNWACGVSINSRLAEHATKPASSSADSIVVRTITFPSRNIMYKSREVHKNMVVAQFSHACEALKREASKRRAFELIFSPIDFFQLYPKFGILFYYMYEPVAEEGRTAEGGKVSAGLEQRFSAFSAYMCSKAIGAWQHVKQQAGSTSSIVKTSSSSAAASSSSSSSSSTSSSPSAFPLPTGSSDFELYPLTEPVIFEYHAASVLAMDELLRKDGLTMPTRRPNARFVFKIGALVVGISGRTQQDVDAASAAILAYDKNYNLNEFSVQLRMHKTLLAKDEPPKEDVVVQAVIPPAMGCVMSVRVGPSVDVVVRGEAALPKVISSFSYASVFL